MLRSPRRLRTYVVGAVVAAVLAVGAVTLTSPWAFGWPAANERPAVLATALRGLQGGRSAIKLVPATALPTSVAVPPLWAHANVWVVAKSGYRLAPAWNAIIPAYGSTGTPSPTWTVEVFSEDSQMPIGGGGGTTGSWPPFFDRLPDRSTPRWWPLPVPSPEVAAPILVVIASLTVLLVLGAAARGTGRALSRGSRRLGRPT